MSVSTNGAAPAAVPERDEREELMAVANDLSEAIEWLQRVKRQLVTMALAPADEDPHAA